ncbi:MAG TPA: DUF3466 family protein [Candidatus Caenarcaniphilales bacterium]
MFDKLAKKISNSPGPSAVSHKYELKDLGADAIKPVLEQKNAVQDLGTLGGTQSIAYGVNDAGQAVGFSQTTDNKAIHAFLYTEGKLQDLGTLKGDTSSFAYGINNQGDVVGSSNTSSLTGGTSRAFLYSQGQMYDLNHLVKKQGEVELTEATSINDQGEIGAVGLLNGQQHAFLITPMSKK